MTEDERDELRRVWRDRYPVAAEVAPGQSRLWAVADNGGLRAVLACAIQSCDRSLRTHITGEVGSDDWSLWVAIEAPLHALMRALVLRRVAPGVEVLAAPWEQVMGALPPLDDLTEAAPGPSCCWECKRPLGARLVTEAEAARHARLLRANTEGAARAAYEREDAMHRRMQQWKVNYLAIAETRDVIEQTLNWPGKVPVKVREWVADQLRMRLQIPLELDEPAQAAPLDGSSNRR